MKKFFSALVTGCMLFASVAPVSAATQPLTSLNNLRSGDLIRGQSHNAVYYYGRDGFRYVFANSKVYESWYGNSFSTVKWISDADLATIQLGGNVTYRPGLRMVKINSDPKTYAVGENGMLHWVTTEAIAVALYGANWNTKIDDIPDAQWTNYHIGSDVLELTDFKPAEETTNATDINEDKNLRAPVYINITDTEFNPSSITVQVNTAVRFTNTGTINHTATADDLSWGTGTLKKGQNFARYFKKPGTYSFFCSLHPTLRGTIIVQ